LAAQKKVDQPDEERVDGRAEVRLVRVEAIDPGPNSRESVLAFVEM
jgi:hypothetical protein